MDDPKPDLPTHDVADPAVDLPTQDADGQKEDLPTDLGRDARSSNNAAESDDQKEEPPTPTTELIHNGSSWSNIAAESIVGLGIFAFLVANFRPSLLLSRTLTTGGDTGSHHYISKAFAEYFPFSIHGWATGWFGGMPMLEFYFPLPYIMIWFLTHVVGYDIAFKLVTVVGIFTLPLMAYFLFRLMDAPRIAAAIAPAGAIAFLWIEGRNVGGVDTNLLDIFGGFITSTLAGEFAYSIGLSFVVLGCGLLFRTTRRCDKAWPWGWIGLTALCCAAAALSHMLPAVVFGIFAPAVVIGKNFWRRCAVVALVAVLAGGLASIWLIPAAVMSPFTAGGIWTNVYGAMWFVPRWFWPILAVAGGGTIYAVWQRRVGMLILAWIAAGSLLVFLLAPTGQVVNGRFLPAYYLATCLLAAWTLGEVIDLFLGRQKSVWGLALRSGLAVVLAGGLAAVTVLASTKVEFWIPHNYKGYEAQPAYPELKSLMSAIDALPAGRVAWEYNADYDRFGTPRALENIPFFTNHDTMEGLLIESSGTGRAVFWLQGEYSPVATGAVPGFQYPSFNPADAVRHMREYGVRYFVAESPQIKEGISSQPGVRALTTSSRFTIYEIEGASLVQVPTNTPVYLEPKGRDWRDLYFAWLKDSKAQQIPITFGALGKWEPSNGAVPGSSLSKLQQVETVKEVALVTPQPTQVGGPLPSHLTRSTISFKTDRIGQPHLIAVSYFPNWTVKGAQGPYLVSPSFMLVFPTQENVQLIYSTSLPERVGWWLSLLSFLIVAGLLIFSVRNQQLAKMGIGVSAGATPHVELPEQENYDADQVVDGVRHDGGDQ